MIHATMNINIYFNLAQYWTLTVSQQWNCLKTKLYFYDDIWSILHKNVKPCFQLYFGFLILNIIGLCTLQKLGYDNVGVSCGVGLTECSHGNKRLSMSLYQYIFLQLN